jgi:hypothetical protein
MLVTPHTSLLILMAAVLKTLLALSTTAASSPITPSPVVVSPPPLPVVIWRAVARTFPISVRRAVGCPWRIRLFGSLLHGGIGGVGEVDISGLVKVELVWGSCNREINFGEATVLARQVRAHGPTFDFIVAASSSKSLFPFFTSRLPTWHLPTSAQLGAQRIVELLDRARQAAVNFAMDPLQLGKTFVKTVVRMFYETEHIVVIDALVYHGAYAAHVFRNVEPG